jgi:hypothetical protein
MTADGRGGEPPIAGALPQPSGQRRRYGAVVDLLARLAVLGSLLWPLLIAN